MTTLDFACSELARYTRRMGIDATASLSVDPTAFDPSRFFKFDPSLDDAFRISFKNGVCSITATNERAALIAVYRFLKEQGARFFKPGADGEYIPHIASAHEVELEIYASVRHRGVTDGNSGQNARDFRSLAEYVDWLPKVMMNSFFIEMPDYYEPMTELYEAKDNPFAAPRSLSKEEYLAGEAEVMAAVKLRSILFHGVGHGWTVKCMKGVDKITRKEDRESVCQNPDILAEIDGKREFFKYKPLYTNLCYSRPDVRRAFAEAVADYAEEHREYDYLHVWLADYFNNFCECEDCKKHRPADLYVMMLNEIDSILTERGLDQKIVFLIYFELAFPPLTERINNEDRFVMMFAPYGRDFTVKYRDVKRREYTPPPYNGYARSDMNMPHYLSELADWQKIFSGDSFVFDYSTYDYAGKTSLTNLRYAAIPHCDCCDLTDFGLNGRIECASTRALTPTSLVLYSMGEAMLSKNSDYRDICKDYFTKSYGEDENVSTFLNSLSELLPYDFFMSRSTSADGNDLRAAKDLIADFTDELSGYMPKDEFHRLNCAKLKEYLKTVSYLLDSLIAKLRGADENTLISRVKELKSLAYKSEDTLGDEFSAYDFCSCFGGILLKELKKSDF